LQLVVILLMLINRVQNACVKIMHDSTYSICLAVGSSEYRFGTVKGLIF